MPSQDYRFNLQQAMNQLNANNKIQELESQNIAYMLMLAQQTQCNNMSALTPGYPQYGNKTLYMYPDLNCCCANSKEQFIYNNLNSCVQAYPTALSEKNVPKVSLKKPDREIKKKSKLLDTLKILCLILAIISKFISKLTLFPLILELCVYAVIIALLLSICFLEKK